MTINELYNAIRYSLFGNTPNIPQGFYELMRGNNGFIAKAHKNIQYDADYWFTRTTVRVDIPASVVVKTAYTTTSLEITPSDTSGIFYDMAVINEDFPEHTFINGTNPVVIVNNYPTKNGDSDVRYCTRRITLPSDFKREISVAQRAYKSGMQIKRVSASEITGLYDWRSVSHTPFGYWLYGDYMYFEPAIIGECSILIDYYKMIQYNDADNYEDEVTIYGQNAIINYCAYNGASLLQDFQKAKYFAEMYNASMAEMRRINLLRESAFDSYDARLL